MTLGPPSGPATVVVDARRHPAGLAATLAALDALAWPDETGAPGGPAAVLVVDGTGTDGRDLDPVDRARRQVDTPLVAFLDAGLAPEPGWLVAAAAALDHSPRAAAVVSLVIDGETGRAVAAPAGVSFVGHPLPAAGPDRPLPPGPTLVLGPAWVGRGDVLAALGEGLRLDPPDDPDDGTVGLGPSSAALDRAWRWWLAGRPVLVDPTLVVRTTAPPPPDEAPDLGDVAAAERDALIVLSLNLAGAELDAVLPAALALSPRRAAARTGAVPGAGDGHADDPVHDPVHELGRRRFLALRSALEPERERRQAERRLTDAQIVDAFRHPLQPDTDDDAYRAAFRRRTRALPADLAFGCRSRIVVATDDVLTPRMAGPAIRARRIATELALEHEVVLAGLSRVEIDDPTFEVRAVTHAEVEDLLEWCDVFLYQGWVMAARASFTTSGKVFVIDVYDPMHLEQLEQARDGGEEHRRTAVRNTTAVLNEQLLRGDLFLCASDKQRNLWLGHLASLGRINPDTYDADPTLERLITVVPFGISDEPPVRTRDAVKGVLPGVGPDDAVILWGGGVYNWLDPITLVRAVDRLRHRRPDVRLVFLGMRHPHPDAPEMRVAYETRRLCDELGLTGTHVIFNEEWVAYDDRQNFLLDADIAVSTQLHHVETDYSFRTRMLDYFWASLPTVATTGDSLAELVERRGLGLTVPPGDVAALEGALFRLLDEPELAAACRANLAAVVPDLRWAAVLRPLVRFCRSPHRAEDLVAGPLPTGPWHAVSAHEPPGGLGHDLALVVAHLRSGGPGLLVRKAGARAGRAIDRVVRRLLGPSLRRTLGRLPGPVGRWARR